MINSRPRSNALFALTIFIIIALSLAYAGIQGPINSGTWHWYNYVAVYFFGPLAIIIALRMLYNFKLIQVHKDRLDLKYPFRLYAKRFYIKELEFWNETTVKTGKTLFRELEMRFPGRTIKISKQENSSYDQIFSYFQKKAPRKRK